ncbi:hypothetical protein [Jhaorihella thermophila]|uniref:Glutamate-1-semialdehyde 2,1-aminomutase n=1 Tax=Jhaorihella thermophila TaxID=488547 RepID=A0A1H5TXA6_9RHOB|nr:hypothetical protein [Jhaorihella thermophila]SEF67360.1 glutamate-1-semialdehyde 2,1-aminomutase [Jhaorihella thermophila]
MSEIEIITDGGRRRRWPAAEKLRIVGDPTLFEVVFTADPVRDCRNVFRSDTARAALFNRVLIQEGLFKSPGKTCPSLTLTLTEEDFELARAADAKAAAAVASA